MKFSDIKVLCSVFKIGMDRTFANVSMSRPNNLVNNCSLAFELMGGWIEPCNSVILQNPSS